MSTAAAAHASWFRSDLATRDAGAVTKDSAYRLQQTAAESAAGVLGLVYCQIAVWRRIAEGRRETHRRPVEAAICKAGGNPSPLHELFATTGEIRASDSELHITLAPLSSPHRTRAAQALCKMLDQTATIFPGSRLRMRFATRPPPRIGLAFPGLPIERTSPTAGVPGP